MPLSFDDYHAMLEDRPVKASPVEVGYREADPFQHRCGRCIHYYERVRDRWGVCEIMRPSGDTPVDPDYTCDFFTTDGEKFPFRKGR